tara:strand:- start:96 stop:296 length:201 start_codon:yes stop_codon:yes gene_type:complete
LKFVVSATNPTPIKNNKVIDDDKRIIVIGSVDGVIIAPAIAEDNITTLQADNIFLQEINSKKPKIN